MRESVALSALEKIFSVRRSVCLTVCFSVHLSFQHTLSFLSLLLKLILSFFIPFFLQSFTSHSFGGLFVQSHLQLNSISIGTRAYCHQKNHTFLGMEFWRLHPTIFECSKTETHADFTELLARCAKILKAGEDLWSLSSSLFTNSVFCG